jgi:hypothetical protein
VTIGSGERRTAAAVPTVRGSAWRRTGDGARLRPTRCLPCLVWLVGVDAIVYEQPNPGPGKKRAADTFAYFFYFIYYNTFIFI